MSRLVRALPTLALLAIIASAGCGLPPTCTAETWFRDGDADGVGDSEGSVDACTAPAGYVLLAGDCDDARPDVRPGAAEVCDGNAVDEDCNGVADDADPSAIGGVAWYGDVDQDGYGDSASPGAGCTAPVASSPVAGDCDDTDAAVHPAAPESCNGPDRDCDGVAPPACLSVDGADALYMGPSSGAALSAVALPGDVDGDRHPDVLLSAPGVRPEGSDAPTSSAAWLFSGGPDGRLPMDHAARFYNADIHDIELDRVSAPGDVDGDGIADVLLGGPTRGWVVASSDPDGTRGARVELGAPTWEETDGDGITIAAAGDVDGDGLGDVLVARPGQAQVGCWWGHAGAGTRASSLITGRSGTLLGSAVASAGDTDADGVDDVLLAADCGGGGCGAGLLYVVHGPMPESASVDDIADVAIQGESTGQAVRLQLDAHARGGGDADGDGTADILVGVDVRAGSTTAPAAYILPGPGPRVRQLGNARTTLRRADRADAVSAVAWVGDVDGDDRTDVAVTSANDAAGGLDAGAAWILTGDPQGDVDPASLRLTVRGPVGSAFGADVAGGADLDGDGLPELLIGAPGLDPNATDAGAVYRFSGATLLGILGQ